MSDGVPLLKVDFKEWLHTFRDITNATNERTVITGSIPRSGLGNNAPAIDYSQGRTISTALVLANMNSLPLDWAARFSVGGLHMNFFILRQLPVLPPEAYLKNGPCGTPWVQLVVPRVLELTYTSLEMGGFAVDLGYHGPPFPWDEDRRHCLKCELDAIFSHMYGLSRTDLEWILDALPPSSSFPALKKNEIKQFGEYRTHRLVLDGWDRLNAGDEFLETSA